jgi:hypothetical protein
MEASTEIVREDENLQGLLMAVQSLLQMLCSHGSVRGSFLLSQGSIRGTSLSSLIFSFKDKKKIRASTGGATE